MRNHSKLMVKNFDIKRLARTLNEIYHLVTFTGSNDNKICHFILSYSLILHQKASHKLLFISSKNEDN